MNMPAKFAKPVSIICGQIFVPDCRIPFRAWHCVCVCVCFSLYVTMKTTKYFIQLLIHCPGEKLPSHLMPNIMMCSEKTQRRCRYLRSLHLRIIFSESHCSRIAFIFYFVEFVCAVRGWGDNDAHERTEQTATKAIEISDDKSRTGLIVFLCVCLWCVCVCLFCGHLQNMQSPTTFYAHHKVSSSYGALAAHSSAPFNMTFMLWWNTRTKACHIHTWQLTALAI